MKFRVAPLILLIFFSAASFVIGIARDKLPSKDTVKQKTDSLTAASDSLETDSLQTEYTMTFADSQDLIKKVADSVAKVYSYQFEEKQRYTKQLILLGNIKSEMLKAKEYLKRGLDTNDLIQGINVIKSEFEVASEGTGETSGIFSTTRNSKTSELLMEELVIKLDHRKMKIESYLEVLQEFRKNLDSMQTVPIIWALPKDSALFFQYFDKILIFSTENSGTDSILTSTIKTLEDLNDRIDALRDEILDKEQLILSIRNQLAITKFVQSDSLSEITGLSYKKNSEILKYFFGNNLWLISFMIIFAAGMCLLAVNVRKKIRNASLSEISNESRLVLRFPALSAVFVTIMVFEFFFPRAPVIFQGLLWLIASLLLTIILNGYQTRRQRFFWLFLFAGFVIIFLCDLILGMSVLEKWLLLFLAAAGLAMNIAALRKSVFFEKHSGARKILLAITSFLLLCSIIFNISGYFNSSKGLVSANFFILLTAYLLYWTTVLGIEFMNLISLVYEAGGNEKVKLQLNRFRERTPIALKIFVFIGWLILLLKNFNAYDFLSDSTEYFFGQERVIGDFKFTLGSILVFVFIIFVAAVISKIIAFIADKLDSVPNKKSGLSNWMLLIRIAVLTTGVLLAFAATGIPIDRLTIIIGSLGIGIGLGLQNVVNNLVSGILLAFEKPFRIGDRLEVSDKIGKVKEIGIRSSKLTTPEGSTIIIPNGDLLSKIVTNWTLRGTNRRTELKLSFKYGNNINELKGNLQNILDNEQDIIKTPPPVVLLNDYNTDTTEYRLLYWTQIDKADKVKSDLMLKIEEKIKKPVS